MTLLVAAFVLRAQAPESFPKGYFRPPMDIPFSISGAFAEIRSNHFHSGIDLRTGAKVGVPVYAAAEGYLARVAISPWGGGKVLYLDHPNGMRTVYMHLDDFCGPIADWIRQVQYAKQAYAIDTTLPEGLIPVKEGDLIAHSGNSGSSGGPHLHFEIRYADNDQTINPFYFGFDYTDKVKPTIWNVKLYPADATTSIEGVNKPIFLNASSKGAAWRDTVHLSGPFYAGIYVTDRCATTDNKNGVERIELWVDGVLAWRYSVPSFRFEETRSINALIDYPQYESNRHYYILTRRLPGVPTDYALPLNGGNGIFLFEDDAAHQLRYLVYDYKGNVAERTCYVKRGNTRLLAAKSQLMPPSGTEVEFRRAAHVEAADFYADLKPYTLYADDVLLHYAKRDSRYLSPVHTFQPRELNLPPHKGYKMRIAVPSEVDDRLLRKMLIVRITAKGPTALTSRVEGRWVVSNNTRVFGDFALMADTVAPKVRAVNFSEGKSVAGKQLRMKVTDNLSGVAAYHCYLNGEWILAEYDGKTATLSVNTAGKLRKGENTLRCVVVDAKGNTTDLLWKRLLN